MKQSSFFASCNRLYIPQLTAVAVTSAFGWSNFGRYRDERRQDAGNNNQHPAEAATTVGAVLDGGSDRSCRTLWSNPVHFWRGNSSSGIVTTTTNCDPHHSSIRNRTFMTHHHISATQSSRPSTCTTLETTSLTATSSIAGEETSSLTKLIFLGTGSSTGCPRPLCSMLFSGTDDNSANAELTKMKQDLKPFCRTSNLATGGDPAMNKNYRNNPSFLVSTATTVRSGNDQTPVVVQKNVIIDAGKTFREGALRWLPIYNIRSLDAIVLTHQHMDAAAGLDDVRGFQKYVRQKVDDDDESKPRHPMQQLPMPLFLSSECLSCLQDQFPWLLPRSQTTQQDDENDTTTIKRHVASFDVTVFKAFQPFDAVPGLTITPLPVMHGEDLVSFGFHFTVGGGAMNVVYLSDISRMLPETLDYIQTQLPQPTNLLILDALHMSDDDNPVHFSLRQAVALVRLIRPEQTYLVGMNCDSFLPHDEMNAQLRKEYGNSSSSSNLDIQLAHDGLVIDVPLLP